MTTIDTTTRRWTRNAADERAAANGCRFDLEAACWPIWWIGRYCRLYEGEWAGEPVTMRAAWSMNTPAILDDWEKTGKRKSVKRMRDYMDCVDAGERCDWQYESVARIFGWVRHSERWKRDVRRFNRGGVWVPKKNKKSPTMAAVALYLLCGDGEAGGKVFLGAKDGTQLRKNVSLHILQMVEQSPELRGVCKINLNEMTVAHLPSKSLLMPLSSSNSRTQESKEGLNGSLLVDETHVVDREFIKRVDRTGISRSEPLFLQFSTAGKDPDSYGKGEFDRGVEVESGRLEDDAYFFAYYGAPQTLTDEQLAEDPEGIISAANPALGHTIELSEALADYRRSRVSLGDLADFKTYRLNIWQRSANPWIRADDWEKCGRVFAEDDLSGQPCAAAFDLGQTDDMSALSLVFPEDLDAWAEATAAIPPRGPEWEKEKNRIREREKLISRGPEVVGKWMKENPASETEYDDIEKEYQESKSWNGEAKRTLAQLEQPVKALTWYWLPEAAVERYGHEVEYAKWVKDGFLRKTSGSTLEPDEILSDMLDIFRWFSVKILEFDPWHGALIAGAIRKEMAMPEECCVPFKQSIQHFAFPSALFERLVISGKLHHNNNPITTWQAGHVQKAIDNNLNMRPVKPKRQNRKKIDGIVSLIMALDGATRIRSLTPTGASIYDNLPGVLFA